MSTESETYQVATFYQFVTLPDCREWQEPLFRYCQAQEVCGTILLAEEGINGTIAGTTSAVTAVLDYLKQDPRLAMLGHRAAVVPHPPFQRLKVKLKSEIVTFGQPKVQPSQQVGTYIAPQDWNQLINDPQVLLVDTRNHYEVAIGTFRGAVNPETASFREFAQYVDQSLDPQQHHKVAMFCTGGIRCEKASAYLLHQGFEQVYHLQGGILNYLESIPEDESLWEGECFVFDERVAVKHGLALGSYGMCQACGYPLSAADQASEHYQPGQHCPHCMD